ncbi:alpha/beta hydrolase [Candidatus Saccharibacteria bacterium]|nr:alpha/beta hydrolase [Candidatus Saccharibacteria bacterium]MCB9834921.1 alpha/beta hydrolase [Candidatus Nomurabacteria bacterium]
MAKTAWLLHGTGGSDKDYFWFGDSKKYLESKGYEVWWPLLPNTDKPNLDETRDFIEDNMPMIDENTIIVGHSSACPLILHMLESFKVKVKQVILVSGYYQTISDESSNMLPEIFDWEAIKNNADEIIIINSDNDPWGCDDRQARLAVEKLGAKFVFAEGQGHMGSTTYNQPYREFSKIRDLLDA